MKKKIYIYKIKNVKQYFRMAWPLQAGDTYSRALIQIKYMLKNKDQNSNPFFCLFSTKVWNPVLFLVLMFQTHPSRGESATRTHNYQNYQWLFLFYFIFHHFMFYDIFLFHFNYCTLYVPILFIYFCNL